MGAADPLAAGLLVDLLRRDGETQLLRQPLQHALVAVVPGPLEALQLLVEGPAVGLGEVDQQVHGAGGHLAGDLAARDEGDADLGRPLGRRLQPVQPVVVGEGHRRAPGGSRQLHLSLAIPAVDTQDRTESWTSSGRLAIGTLVAPASAAPAWTRPAVAHRASGTPAAHVAPTDAGSVSPSLLWPD